MAEGRITAIVQYEDIGAAVEWLGKAFGFEEVAKERMEADDGRVWHSSASWRTSSGATGPTGRKIWRVITGTSPSGSARCRTTSPPNVT